MKLLIIDFMVKLSMVSIDSWTDVELRLREILMMIPEKILLGLSIMTVADMIQLPPVRGKLIFP